jgi:hypothetical protein
VVRATAATAVDSRGHVYSALVNQPRWNAMDTDGDGVDDDVGLLIEPVRTNLVLQSENLGTTWTATNSPTRTPAAHTLSGIALDLIGDASASTRAHYDQSVTFTGDAAKAFSIVVRKNLGTTVSLLRVYNATTTTTVLFATVGWFGSSPAVTMTTGTYLGLRVLADGCARLFFQTTSVTATNAHTIEISPAALLTSDNASTGSIYVGGIQVEDAPYPSAYIKTTTGTVQRLTETCSFPIAFKPQNLTISGLISWPGHGSSATQAAQVEASGATHGVFALGDSNTGAGRETLTLDLVTINSVPELQLAHLVNAVGATVSVSLAGLTAPLSYAATLHIDSSITLSVTGSNGASGTLSSSVPAIAFQTAFYGNHLWVGSREGGTAPGGFTTRSLAIDAGTELAVTPGSYTGVGSIAVRAVLAGVGALALTHITGTGSLAAGRPVMAATGTAVGGSGGGSGITYVVKDFETGSIGPEFYDPSGSRITVVNDPIAGGGHGKVARVSYIVSTPAGVGQDDNEALLQGSGPVIGLGQEIWFQGEMCIDPAARHDPSVQRKYLYWGPLNLESGPRGFSFVLLSFAGELAMNVFPHVTTNFTYDDPTTVNLTTGVWHPIKVRLRVNSAFAATDGLLRVWIDDTLVFSFDNVSWTDPTAWAGASPSEFAFISWGVGYQLDVSQDTSEYRYWDNLRFASTEAALGLSSGAISALGSLVATPRFGISGFTGVKVATGTGSLAAPRPGFGGTTSGSPNTITSLFPSAADGTLLTAVVEPGGATWTKTADSDATAESVVASGKLYDNGASGVATRYQFSASPSSADYTVRCTLAGTANASMPCLLIRTDLVSGNYYYAEFNPFDGHWRMHKVLAYADTTIANLDVSFVSGSLIELTTLGTRIGLTVDGTEILVVFDSDISAAGHGGCGFTLALGGATSSPLLASWEITCATGFGNSRSGSGSVAVAPHVSGSGTLTVSAITGTGSLSPVPHFISTIPSASDTFTDTTGTLLNAHTADTGQSWTFTADCDSSPDVTVGQIQIINNHANCKNSSDNSPTNGGRATIDVSGAGTPTAIAGSLLRVGAGDSFPSLWLRAQNATRTGYAVRYTVVADLQWHLSRWSSGSETVMGSTSGLSNLVDGDHATITLSEAPGAGGSLDVTVHVVSPYDDQTVTFNDATPLAAGAPGISLESFSNEVKVWDSITVTF